MLQRLFMLAQDDQSGGGLMDSVFTWYNGLILLVIVGLIVANKVYKARNM
jgi:hypothetical protein